MTDKISFSEQLIYSTVRIETNNGVDDEVGTGFFYEFSDQSNPSEKMVSRGIIANKHLLKNVKKIKFKLNMMDEDDTPIPGYFTTVDLRGEDFKSLVVSHPDDEIDLCFLPTRALLKPYLQDGFRFFNLSLDRSLIPTTEEINKFSAIETVTMVGYPNGIWDEVNNKPIVRQGITSTPYKNDYFGKSIFLIDAVCWPGSSGSPIFLFNQGPYNDGDGVVLGGGRIKLLGVLSHHYYDEIEGKIMLGGGPTEASHTAKLKIPMNLGVVIKAQKLFDFEKIFKTSSIS